MGRLGASMIERCSVHWYLPWTSNEESEHGSKQELWCTLLAIQLKTKSSCQENSADINK